MQTKFLLWNFFLYKNPTFPPHFGVLLIQNKNNKNTHKPLQCSNQYQQHQRGGPENSTAINRNYNVIIFAKCSALPQTQETWWCLALEKSKKDGAHCCFKKVMYGCFIFLFAFFSDTCVRYSSVLLGAITSLWCTLICSHQQLHSTAQSTNFPLVFLWLIYWHLWILSAQLLPCSPVTQ